MKKKKGFTLIELLAVIVVLAVIMVIAVPKILEVIENADKQAYKESAELMAHTAQIQYQTSEVTGSAPVIPDEGIVYTFTEGVQTVSGNYELLKFKGDKPYSGTITLTKDKKVIIDKLVSKNKKWCAIKEENEKQARVGRSTDPEFACVVEEETVEDTDPCSLATNKDETIYYIDSPSDLYAFSQSVNLGTVDYSGKTVKVRNDLDMSTAKGDCVTSFDPIGTSTKPFIGTFDGGAKTISNLTINKSGQDYVGLFGYVKGTEEVQTNIYGIRMINELDNEGNPKGSIIGKNYVGGIVGYVGPYTTIKEIELDNIKANGSTHYTSAFVGYVSTSLGVNLNNILIKSATVHGWNHVGFLSGYEYDVAKVQKSIVENLTYSIGYSATSGRVYKTDSTNNTYHSNSSTINGSNTTDGFDPKGIDDINFYEAAGLDTWIGGDDDESGYYFDYDDTGKVVLKSVEKNPITFYLSKDSDGNYLIKNEKDFKEASTKPSEKYKIENNLDFSLNKYYMLGSQYNPFKGTLIGNDKTISNVTINGNKEEYLGMIGYIDSATIYGLNLKNIEVNGYDNVGIFGYAKGTEEKRTNIYGIRLVNDLDNESNPKTRISSIAGHVGGLVGYVNNYTTIKEIELDNINVYGDGHYIAGAIGYVNSNTNTINNILIKNAIIDGWNHVGYLSGYEYDVSKPNNSIIEKLTYKLRSSSGIYSYTTDQAYNTHHSSLTLNNGTYVTDGYDSKGIDDINFYESAGLDTWIGGDNDSSGYYFDYDGNNRVILKSVKQNPITFNLSKDSEGNYLIKNESDWKVASIKPTEKYKLENNLDFNSNKYYMLGGYYNPFSGTLIGNDKTIRNVTVNGSRVSYLGIIGLINSGTIYGLTLNNINVHGYNYVGVFGCIKGVDDTKRANIYAIRIVNDLDSTGQTKGNIKAANYAGGLVGYVSSYANIKEIELDNIFVYVGTHYVGGLVGYTASNTNSMNNILIKKAIVQGWNYVGFLSGYEYDVSKVKNTIVENLAFTNRYSATGYVYTTNSSYNSYHSNACTLNGSTNGTFDSSLIGDLDYYTNIIETLYNGDVNGTGYFFDYVDDTNGIRLVKAYTPVETDTPTEQTGCTITYGEVESGCYLYKSGVHGNYLYWAATSEDTGTGAACTGTGRDAAYRQRIYYNCN